MGWTPLLDRNTAREIGMVGDSVWDIMGEAFDQIVIEYKRVWGRPPTVAELASIIEFTLPREYRDCLVEIVTP